MDPAGSPSLAGLFWVSQPPAATSHKAGLWAAGTLGVGGQSTALRAAWVLRLYPSSSLHPRVPGLGLSPLQCLPPHPQQRPGEQGHLRAGAPAREAQAGPCLTLRLAPKGHTAGWGFRGVGMPQSGAGAQVQRCPLRLGRARLFITTGRLAS